MEGRTDQENLLHLMSLNFCGKANDVCFGTEDHANQHFLMATGRNGNQPNALPLSQWTHFQKAPRNYVELLSENSTFLENATGADMLETISSPICGTESVYGGSEIQRELLFNNIGKACDYKPTDAFLYMDALKVSNNEEESTHRFTSFQSQIIAQQNHTSLSQEPYEEKCNLSQLHAGATTTPSFLPSKRRSKSTVSRQRAAATDRDRRVRISERLRALQELLPNSVEGSQATVMEDIIDHIKFLQLQLMELSRSRLDGQATSCPFIFLEGYGHYVLNEQTTTESLEEMMGKLLEMNPVAASQLLESRGLFMMPMSSVEELHQV